MRRQDCRFLYGVLRREGRAERNRGEKNEVMEKAAIMYGVVGVHHLPVETDYSDRDPVGTANARGIYSVMCSIYQTSSGNS